MPFSRPFWPSPERNLMPTPIRRAILAASGLAIASSLLLTGCAGPGEAPAPDAGGATRTITSEAGEATIPTDPSMIVALDEPSALNMMSIGVTPDIVFASWRTTVPREIIEDAGITVVDTSEFYPASEEVAAHKPDLIVGTWADGWSQSAPDYSEIAPMVGGLYTATGAEIIEAYGEYFDRAEEAAGVSAALEAAPAAAADAQPADGQSLSVLMSFGGDMPLYMDSDNSLHSSIADSGFTRPALQDTAPSEGSAYGGWTTFSPEQLTEHDADVLAVAVGLQYSLEGVTELAPYDSLEAVKQQRSVIVDGDIWSGGAAFYTYWVLRDLESIASGELVPGVTADAASRWSDYTAAIAR